MKRSRLSMRNIAIGLGTGAREVGLYRVAGARRTDGVAAPTGVAVTTGVVAGVAGGIPGTDAHPVRRCKVDAARLIDGDGEAAGGHKLGWQLAPYADCTSTAYRHL